MEVRREAGEPAERAAPVYSSLVVEGVACFFVDSFLFLASRPPPAPPRPAPPLRRDHWTCCVSCFLSSLACPPRCSRL